MMRMMMSVIFLLFDVEDRTRKKKKKTLAMLHDRKDHYIASVFVDIREKR
jgi:hypothetical protein